MPEKVKGSVAAPVSGSAPTEVGPIAAKASAAPGLPAGIRWWEACGGWSVRYWLGNV
ncbi:hypothetical protein GCM10012320_32280 [Sinomonas cellulolyticus]|jgi:hypothetical protein|uniref:Uncharacterized protein n=1 Tax=Sinomonas cellulolyticus TaxID=2801916 RepID=A0ABS1JXZ8_9MICC|nr:MULTISPECIES: hypothetical protein [Sinomonas]MBL0704256.1 hypothetical protein [Sinomonas cellulolyticus]GHG58572.1 hypothetical protein GCM10012320_32280 [Sinomonas sp. KCTC 49339]